MDLRLKLTTSKNLYAFVCLELNLPGGGDKGPESKYRTLVAELYE